MLISGEQLPEHRLGHWITLVQVHDRILFDIFSLYDDLSLLYLQTYWWAVHFLFLAEAAFFVSRQAADFTVLGFTCFTFVHRNIVNCFLGLWRWLTFLTTLGGLGCRYFRFSIFYYIYFYFTIFTFFSLYLLFTW